MKCILAVLSVITDLPTTEEPHNLITNKTKQTDRDTVDRRWQVQKKKTEKEEEFTKNQAKSNICADYRLKKVTWGEVRSADKLRRERSRPWRRGEKREIRKKNRWHPPTDGSKRQVYVWVLISQLKNEKKRKLLYDCMSGSGCVYKRD